MNLQKFKPRTYISFDWAIKRLLRGKADYTILESFLSALLNRGVVVKSILESESNQESADDKRVVVDLLCELDNDDLVLIEVQYFNQDDYFQRILFGVSKVLTEYLSAGDLYKQVKKVLSVSMVYFNLGEGEDYLYHGTTTFVGMNKKDVLVLTRVQQEAYQKTYPQDLFPEYYLIKINRFNDIARTPLEDWLYYLKNHELPQNCDQKILTLLSDQLKYEKMETKEKTAYRKHLKNLMVSQSSLDTSYRSGFFEGKQMGFDQGIEKGIEQGIEKGIEQGIEKGIEQGVEKEKVNTIIAARKKGLEISLISEIVEMPKQEVKRILKAHQLS